MVDVTPETVPSFDKHEPIVAMIDFKGRLIVATSLHLYALDTVAHKLRKIDLPIDMTPTPLNLVL
jgi:hypothetical protein